MNVENTLLHSEVAVPAVGPLLVERARSAGVLSSSQIKWCQRNGVALAFDPLQGGWVTSDCTDDLSKPTRAVERSGEPHFVFRPWSPDDAADYARMLSSERLWKFLPESYQGPIDASTAAALIELAEEAYHSVSAVELSGVAIGQTRLRFDEPGSAEVSYWLGEEFWGKGYGSRVVTAYCDKCFQDRPEIARLFARVHEDHVASRRILEKAGFSVASRKGDWIILERRRQG